MSLDKALFTQTALKDGLKIFCKEAVDVVQVAFHCSPRKSIHVASNELAIPQSTVSKVLHKQLWLHAYKLQIVEALKLDDLHQCLAYPIFCNPKCGWFAKIF